MNWYKKSQKQYYYALNCTDLEDGMEIQEMINLSSEVSWKEFNTHVSIEQIKFALGEKTYSWDKKEKGLKIWQDHYVHYYKSEFRGEPCYYLDYSAIEYIFLMGGGIYD
jgi:hypothetical protein